MLRLAVRARVHRERMRNRGAEVVRGLLSYFAFGVSKRFEGCLRSRYCRPLRHSVPGTGSMCGHAGNHLDAGHGAPKGRAALRRRPAKLRWP